MQEQKIETVGVREFRANLHKYTNAGANPIAVTSHGECIGFYIPVKPSPSEKDFEALRQATANFNGMLEQSGFTADEIMVDFKNEWKAELTNDEPGTATES